MSSLLAPSAGTQYGHPMGPEYYLAMPLEVVARGLEQAREASNAQVRLASYLNKSTLAGNNQMVNIARTRVGSLVDTLI